MLPRKLQAPFRGEPKAPSLAEWLVQQNEEKRSAVKSTVPQAQEVVLPTVFSQLSQVPRPPTGHERTPRAPCTPPRRTPPTPRNAHVPGQPPSSRNSRRSRALQKLQSGSLLGKEGGANKRKSLRRIHTTLRPSEGNGTGFNLTGDARSMGISNTSQRLPVLHQGDDAVDKLVPPLALPQKDGASVSQVQTARLPQIAKDTMDRDASTLKQSFRSMSMDGVLNRSSISTLEDEPMILPRVPAKRLPNSGKAATTHLTEREYKETLSTLSPKSKIQSAANSSGPNSPRRSQPVPDIKWRFRQASISATMAQEVINTGRTEQGKVDASHLHGANTAGSNASLSTEPTQQSEYLCFEGWGVDDNYLRSLLGRVVIHRIRHMNLADNRLTTGIMKILKDAAAGGQPLVLQHLNLAKNRLGTECGQHFAAFLEAIKPPLQELDLSTNNLGDNGCVTVCNAITLHCRGLAGLSLAHNDIGYTARGGIAVGALISEMGGLKALELQWNRIQGISAAAVIQGLHENNLMSGQLWRVDLSWNRIGVRCKVAHKGSSKGKDHGGTPECRCETCTATTKAISTLGTVFADGSVLFHIDLSYNSLNAGDCALLADRLRLNHTLFGLHIIGNEASIDDVGFIVPHSPSKNNDLEDLARTNASTFHVSGNPSAKGSHTSNAPVRSCDMADNIILNTAVKSKAATAGRAQVEEKLQLSGRFAATRKFEDVKLNEVCCWICDSWIEESVVYIPGWSGPETKEDEVTQVFVYFGVDGFARPTRLQKTTEKYRPGYFGFGLPEDDEAHLGRLSKAGKNFGIEFVRKRPEAHTHKPIVDAKRRFVVFKGTRMLPPSSTPMQVVFQVNQDIRLADHLPRQPLRDKQTIAAHHDGKDCGGSSSALPPVPVSTETTIDVEEVNIINVGAKRSIRQQSLKKNSLRLLNDPRHRCDLEVFPRRLQHEKAVKASRPWRFETSLFKNYERETNQLIDECFDRDLSVSKLKVFFNKSGQTEFQLNQLFNMLRNNYECVMATFHKHTQRGFLGSRASAGLSMAAFREILSTVCTKSKEPADSNGEEDETPKVVLTPIYDQTFWKNEGDTIFIASSFVDSLNTPENKMTALPKQGLSRFQFLEALGRTATFRFINNQETVDNLGSAAKEIVDALNADLDPRHWRKTLQSELFCEECDLAFQEHLGLLEEVFEGYSKRLRFHHSRIKAMSYGAWLEFMYACEAQEFGIHHLDFGIAFAMGRELQVDEYASFRHMQLTWSEFLVSVGAAVHLRAKVDREPFADELTEFIEGHITQAAISVAAGRHGSVDSSERVVRLVAQIFNEVDTEGCGLISLEDLQRAIKLRNIAQLLKEVGINIEDFKVFFRTLDDDRSGCVTMDEMVQGLMSMKKSLKELERSMAYLRETFKQADIDQSGTLTESEFWHILQSETVRTKLQTMGIESDEIDEIWAAVDSFSEHMHKGVTANEMIAGLMALRNPSNNSQRALNFLRQIFKNADVNHNESLSREEVHQHFCTPAILHRLQEFGVVVPDWDKVFNAIDLNGDGRLSWDEIAQGTQVCWMLHNPVQQGDTRFTRKN